MSYVPRARAMIAFYLPVVADACGLVVEHYESDVSPGKSIYALRTKDGKQTLRVELVASQRSESHDV
jgi:hypothetical protein